MFNSACADIIAQSDCLTGLYIQCDSHWGKTLSRTDPLLMIGRWNDLNGNTFACSFVSHHCFQMVSDFMLASRCSFWPVSSPVAIFYAFCFTHSSLTKSKCWFSTSERLGMCNSLVINTLQTTLKACWKADRQDQTSQRKKVRLNPCWLFNLFVCLQGPPGPPGEDGPQGKDGAKVNFCRLSLMTSRLLTPPMSSIVFLIIWIYFPLCLITNLKHFQGVRKD